MLVRRDTGVKVTITLDTVAEDCADMLHSIQESMLVAARDRREKNSYREPMQYGRFREIMEAGGGFVYAGWCGSAECEAAIKEDTKATIRVLPDEEFRSATAPSLCLKCGGKAKLEALWAKAY